MNQEITFNPDLPFIPQSLDHIPAETLKQLAGKELERQMRQAIARFPREADGRYPLHAAQNALHAIKRHMPCETAIAYSQAIFDACGLDARETRTTRRNAPLCLRSFTERDERIDRPSKKSFAR